MANKYYFNLSLHVLIYTSVALQLYITSLMILALGIEQIKKIGLYNIHLLPLQFRVRYRVMSLSWVLLVAQSPSIPH